VKLGHERIGWVVPQDGGVGETATR
jgi:hypothetical protein